MNNIYFALLVLFTIISSCEETIVESPLEQKQEVLIQFELPDSLLSDMNNVDYFSKKTVALENNRYEQFRLKNEQENYQYRYSFFLLKNEIEDSSKIVKIIPEEETTDDNFYDNLSLENLNSFSGVIFHFDLQGNLTKILKYDSGILKVNSTPDKTKPNCKDCKMQACTTWTTTYEYERDVIQYYQDGEHLGAWYSEWRLVGISEVCTSNGGSVYDYYDVTRSYGKSGSTNQTQPDEHEECMEEGNSVEYCDCVVDDIGCEELEDEIITNQLSSKANCIYQQLKNGNTTIAEYVNNFVGDGSVANLLLTMTSTLSNNVGGITLPPNNYQIEIQFNQNYFNASYTDMGYAHTIIHEIVHAEIYRKMLSSIQEGDLTNINQQELEDVRNDWPGLFDYYSRFFYNEYASHAGQIDYYSKYAAYFEQLQNSWQHEMIAAHYLNIMSEALFDFGNGAFSQGDCDIMALEGLKGTVIWNNLENQQQIINTLVDLNTNGQKNCQ